MDKKKLSGIIAIISIVSVLIMIAWGTIAGSYEHAWLAVFAGGCLDAVLCIWYRINNKE